MRARAPGKLVLSGAYAVLEGAPALVAAVDRYAVADTRRPPPLVTEEVAAAIAAGHLDRAPFFDATALRDGDRKLGLGSSAAVLVASLAAAWLERGMAESDLAASIFEVALEAHRAAQGGGSGIDVAAACFGGVRACSMTLGPDGALSVVEHALPRDLVCVVYSCRGSASTARMLEAVRSLRERDRAAYRAIISEAFAGAEGARDAREARAFVSSLERQAAALTELGRVAGVPIVTREIAALAAEARGEQATVVPSGAGGGDVALYYGASAPSPPLRARAEAEGLTVLQVRLGARGVHRES